MSILCDILQFNIVNVIFEKDIVIILLSHVSMPVQCMHSAILLRKIRLSVHLSVTLWYCIEETKCTYRQILLTIW